MSTIVEVDESGTLRLPQAILPCPEPHTRYVASRQGQQVILAPAQGETPFWMTATPEERAKDILQWAASHTDGPGLSNQAVGRDAIYE